MQAALSEICFLTEWKHTGSLTAVSLPVKPWFQGAVLERGKKPKQQPDKRQALQPIR